MRYSKDSLDDGSELPFVWEGAAVRTKERYQNIKLIEKTPDDFDKPFFPLMLYPSRGKFDHKSLDVNDKALNNLGGRKNHWHVRCTLCENRGAFQLFRRIVLGTLAAVFLVWAMVTFLTPDFVAHIIVWGVGIGFGVFVLCFIWAMCKLTQ